MIFEELVILIKFKNEGRELRALVRLYSSFLICFSSREFRVRNRNRRRG